ncbi:Uncharacterised protein [Pragia fontium]|nr:Uncharacterised protein [Pragia fontium]
MALMPESELGLSRHFNSAIDWVLDDVMYPLIFINISFKGVGI